MLHNITKFKTLHLYDIHMKGTGEKLKRITFFSKWRFWYQKICNDVLQHLNGHTKEKPRLVESNGCRKFKPTGKKAVKLIDTGNE